MYFQSTVAICHRQLSYQFVMFFIVSRYIEYIFTSVVLGMKLVNCKRNGLINCNSLRKTECMSAKMFHKTLLLSLCKRLQKA